MEGEVIHAHLSDSIPRASAVTRVTTTFDVPIRSMIRVKACARAMLSVEALHLPLRTIQLPRGTTDYEGSSILGLPHSRGY